MQLTPPDQSEHLNVIDEESECMVSILLFRLFIVLDV